MGDLVQTIKDGKVVDTESTSSSSKTKSNASDNTLDKDAFLQLLVTQMKYQDPLNPSSNTEYVAQLATFSQLEQLQNLSNASATSQAFSLVGKTVDVTTESATGSTTTITGKVDYVSVSNGESKLSINGNLYSVDQLATVLDSAYVTKQGLPTATQTALAYDADNPKDMNVTVNLGTGDTVADDVAVAIDGTVVDASLVKLSGGKVTIDDSAFANLKNGTYKMTIVFNDSLYTTVKDKVTVQVENSEVTDSSSNSTEAVTT
jgi:flagellar basal-body rod modification protein FlgD